MEIKFGQNGEIVEKIKKNISLSEEKRRKQRLEYNLSQLANGNIQILKSDEFVQGLVDSLLGHGEEHNELKEKLLMSLGEAAISEDVSIRERTLAVLSLACEHYIKNNKRSGILLVTVSFCRWLENEKEMLPGLVVVIKRMEELTAWLLENSFWSEGEILVALFHSIHVGTNTKGPAFRSLISKTLDKFAQKATLENLTNGYLLGDKDQLIFQKILLFFGAKAVIYLLNRVIQSLNRKERLALIDLISAFGREALPTLEECLKKKPPWIVVRNVIWILGEIRNEGSYNFIKEYYRHDDKRVQYELICCVVKIGGGGIVNRLLEGLEIVSDDLKVHIIQLLVEHAGKDEKVLDAICKFVNKRGSFSFRSKNRLISAAIAALRSFPCNKSVKLLRKLQMEYNKMPGSEQTLLQLDEALKVIVPQLRHDKQVSEELPETLSYDDDPLETERALNKVALIEELLRKLVRAGDMSGAGRLLHDQALLAARSKDFLVAEKLRDRILEVNPMALAEAVALGDLIEKEKSTALAGHHLDVWSELYEGMNTEEFNAFYSVLRQEEYKKGDIIAQAGETNDVLYLLNSGHVSLNCMSGGAEVFLKRMVPGTILGGDLFFSSSIWTVTLRALTSVQLQVLDQSVFLEIVEKYPGLEENLRQYCRKFTTVTELLKMSGDERREYPRFPLSLTTHNVLLDPYSHKGKRIIKGELIDISRNGLAFFIKISSRNIAKLLLGRQVLTKLEIAQDKVLFECGGVIVGVRWQDEILDNFIVHVKLSQKIEDATFARIKMLIH